VQDDARGSSVRSFDLYVAENGGDFKVLKQNLTVGQSFDFTGRPGSTYCFFSLATDNVGNTEAMKQGGEACLRVKGNPTQTLVAVLQPNGGEQYCPGSPIPISWTSQGVQKVNILYSRDGGESYQLISRDQPASGSLAWNTSENLMASDKFLIQVEDAANATTVDVSDKAFGGQPAARERRGGRDRVREQCSLPAERLQPRRRHLERTRHRRVWGV
jgi:hypothetical protein